MKGIETSSIPYLPLFQFGSLLLREMKGIETYTGISGKHCIPEVPCSFGR
ncbi:Uncharacterized protein dnm_080310 [Desulfonema magnum]|uniref:Uncharacterized protein n=1 Tax=Desulfonema magnum TaxID=45655 RepID=A0A975BUN5_9BACT|nr:Uncharacterized protein dnm_080310 [Desulfonema magnum]